MYKKSNLPGRSQLQSLTIKIDDHVEFEVEEVLDSRIQRGKLEYLVHWRGYDINDRTWD